MRRLWFVSALVLAAGTTPLLADAIPYGNTGTIAPQMLTFATGNGIQIFYYGSTASFNDTVEVTDVQSGFDSGALLANHATPVGSEVTVGSGAGQISAGDQLIFFIDSPAGKFASVASLSADGVNHAYVTTYSGGMLNGTTVPAGLFVGLEDLPYGSSDLNYNDDTFVFTGVAATPTTGTPMAATPEPSSLVLLGTGLASLAGIARRSGRRP